MAVVDHAATSHNEMHHLGHEVQSLDLEQRVCRLDDGAQYHLEFEPILFVSICRLRVW